MPYECEATGFEGNAMEVKTTVEGQKRVVKVDGRVNTSTAPQFEQGMNAAMDGATYIEVDCAGLEFISSAGLRVLLLSQKAMNRQGKMVLRNVRPEIMDVLEMTGFVDFLDIE